MKIINVVYFTNEKQHCCPDLEIENWFDSILSSKENLVHVSTELQLTRLRLGVKQKDISPFTLNMNTQIIKCDEKGQLSEYPDELDILRNILFDLSR